MTIKNGIRPNEELYGDFKPMPLNVEAVQQRIDFFKGKVGDCLLGMNGLNNDKLNMYYEALKFWRDIKEKHCEVSDG